MLIFHSRTLIPLWSTLASIRYLLHIDNLQIHFFILAFYSAYFLRKINLLLSKFKDFYVTWLIPHRGVLHFSFTRKGIRLYIYVYPSHSYYFYLSRNPDSNRGPIHYEWIALPTEPFRQFTTMILSNPTIPTIVLLIGDKDRALFHIWK